MLHSIVLISVCTGTSDVDIYDNNAGDSNVARKGVLHNIHGGYDTIKDSEINNGKKSDDNCNRKEASLPIEELNVTKTKVLCKNPLNRPRRPPRPQTWLERLMGRKDYDALEKKREARYYRGQDEDEETVHENNTPEHNEEHDIPLDISIFNEEQGNANEGSDHRTNYVVTDQILTDEIQLSFDDFERDQTVPNKKLHEIKQEGIGIWCARKCAIDQTPPCFNSSMTKICHHHIDEFMLNTVGDYIIFQAHCFHRGYFNIQSNSIYYTAQMFATPTGNTSKTSLSPSQHAMIATMNCKELRELSRDIQNYWNCNEKYMHSNFDPPNKFDSKDIDPKYHRVIRKKDFEQLKFLLQFVLFFERLHTEYKIDKIWIMAKSIKERGFEKWHTDKLDSVTTMIVVNVGIQ